MSQAATKEQFDDDIDDDELCRVNRFIYFEILFNIYLQACDECDELYIASQSQQQFEQTDNLTQNSLKRKRLGISTTPNERRAMIKKH
jgi:hypothetical protein